MFGSEKFGPTEALIHPDNIWALWAIVAICAGLAVYLEHKYRWASKVTGCVLALIFAILLSNFGIIPTESTVWDTVWDYVVPLAIPMLLINCDIRRIGKNAGRILIIFLIGSVGTVVGALLAYGLLKDKIPELAGIAGAFTGTYIGGSVNLAAITDTFSISGSLVSASIVADNLLMVLYFFLLVALPSIGFFRKHYPHPLVDKLEKTGLGSHKTAAAEYWKAKEISLKDISLCIAIAFTIVAVSNCISWALGTVIPQGSPLLQVINILLGNKYLWITTLSMICATVKPGFFGEIRGCAEIGTYLIHIFFFVIGVPASIPLIISHSPLLLLFAAIIVIINMVFCLVGGKLLKFSLEEIILASNANIGGPTTAAAMAVSKGWSELVGPVMLIGTLGYVIGTYSGLLVGSILGL